MAEVAGSRNVLVGTAGGVAINVDLQPDSHAVSKNVLLSADYVIAYPPGYPTPPDMTGVTHANLYSPKTITSGTTIKFIAVEANALIAAGKASAA